MPYIKEQNKKIIIGLFIYLCLILSIVAIRGLASELYFSVFMYGLVQAAFAGGLIYLVLCFLGYLMPRLTLYRAYLWYRLGSLTIASVISAIFAITEVDDVSIYFFMIVTAGVVAVVLYMKRHQKRYEILLSQGADEIRLS